MICRRCVRGYAVVPTFWNRSNQKVAASRTRHSHRICFVLFTQFRLRLTVIYETQDARQRREILRGFRRESTYAAAQYNIPAPFDSSCCLPSRIQCSGKKFLEQRSPDAGSCVPTRQGLPAVPAKNEIIFTQTQTPSNNRTISMEHNTANFRKAVSQAHFNS